MYPGEHATTRPDEPAFIMATSGEVVTFAEFEAAANRMAHLCRDAVWASRPHGASSWRTTPRMLECEGGANASGLYYTCVNSYLSPDEVAYIINDCEAQVVVTSAAKREVAAAAARALCPNVQRWLMVDTDEPDGAVRALDDAVAGYPPTRSPTSSSARRCCTRRARPGRPKGILRPLPDVPPGRAAGRDGLRGQGCSSSAKG